MNLFKSVVTFFILSATGVYGMAAGNPWILKSDSIIRIASAADGTLYGLTKSGEVEQYYGYGKWVLVPHSPALSQVTVGTGSFVFGLNSTGAPYERNSTTELWTKLPGTYVQLSATSDGTLFALDKSNRISNFSNGSFHILTWKDFPSGITQIAGVNANEIWAVNSTTRAIHHLKNGTWTLISLTGGLSEISASSDGSAWGINSSGEVYQYNGKTWSRTSQAPTALKQITVGSQNDVWGVTAAGAVYEYSISSLNPPPAAAAVGFTNPSFNSDFTKIATTSSCADAKTKLAPIVDVNNALEKGKKWYLDGWGVGFKASDACLLSVASDRGVHALRLYGANANETPMLYSMSPRNGVVGQEWGSPTSGVYFEARVAMSFPSKYESGDWWPAFWSAPDLASKGHPWPGQPISTSAFSSSSEVDMMEIMPFYKGAATRVSSTMHHWYGVKNETCDGFCDLDTASSFVATDYQTIVSPPAAFEGTGAAPTFITIGVLWMPAAANGGTGYLQYYLNNVAYGTKVQWIGTPETIKELSVLKNTMPNAAHATVTEFVDGQSNVTVPAGWEPSTVKPAAKKVNGLVPKGWVTTPVYSPDPMPSTFYNWAMGAMDLTQHGLILQSGSGAYMDVQWVHVWEK